MFGGLTPLLLMGLLDRDDEVWPVEGMLEFCNQVAAIDDMKQPHLLGHSRSSSTDRSEMDISTCL